MMHELAQRIGAVLTEVIAERGSKELVIRFRAVPCGAPRRAWPSCCGGNTRRDETSRDLFDMKEAATEVALRHRSHDILGNGGP